MKGLAAIHLAAMPDAQDDNDDPIALKLEDNPVVTDAETKPLVGTLEFRHISMARACIQAYGCPNAVGDVPIEAAEIPK
jgi:hypothetical protein